MNQEILVIKHGALGDFVLASGKMRTIRDSHPDARITLVTERFLVGLAQCMGLFDEIVEDSRGYDFKTWYRIIVKTIAKRKWSAIYDLQSSNRTLCRYYPLALLATHNEMHWAHLVNGGVVWRHSTAKIPFLPLFWRNRFQAIDWKEPDLSMCREGCSRLTELPEKFALLIPGCSAGNEEKRWSPSNFRELTTYFASMGLKTVVIGTKSEAEEINAICSGNPNTVNLLGKNSIADIPSIAKKSAVVVGNDTGPSHISYIAGARVVMLFLDKYFKLAAPRGRSNVISLHAKCINDISFEDVKPAIAKVMQND